MTTTLSASRFPGGFEITASVETDADVLPLTAAAPDAHQLRRLALDAVDRFRKLVDAADDEIGGSGLVDDYGEVLNRTEFMAMQDRLEGPVKEAAAEVDAAIRAAHLATGAVDFNHCVITDEGDVLLLDETDWPLPDEVTFFLWPYVTVRIGNAIRPSP